MLYVVIAVAAVALGWFSGGYWRAAQLARQARTDREFGVALLEVLAARWGARVEMVQIAGPSAPPGGPQ